MLILSVLLGMVFVLLPCFSGFLAAGQVEESVPQGLLTPA
jgi:hypothetical protein